MSKLKYCVLFWSLLSKKKKKRYIWTGWRGLEKIHKDDQRTWNLPYEERLREQGFFHP